MEVLQCVLTTIGVSLILILVGPFLLFHTVVGLMWSPPEINAPTGLLKERAVRRMRVTNAGLTLLSSILTVVCLVALWYFGNVLLTAGALLIMLCEMPGFIWRIRMFQPEDEARFLAEMRTWTETRIAPKRWRRSRLLKWLTTLLPWLTFPFVWYALYQFGR